MLHVLFFEIRYRLRFVSTYLFAAVLFLVPFSIVWAATLRVDGVREVVNCSIFVTFVMEAAALFGGLIVAAIVGTAVHRDFEHRTHELFFTTALSRSAYLAGRFFGSFAVALLVFSAIPLGLLAGALLPGVPKDQLVPFQPAVYLQGFWVFVAPTLFLMGALFFVLAALTRSLLAVYAQGVLLLVGYFIALSLLRDIDNYWVGALLDPSGMVAVLAATRYWTAHEMRTELVPLSGYVLGNRLLWTTAGVVMLAAGFRLFRFSAQPSVRTPGTLPWPRPGAGRERAGAAVAEAPVFRSVEFAPAQPVYGRAAVRPQFLTLLGLYTREIVRSIPFLVIVLAGMAMLIAYAHDADRIYGTRVYPVTRTMVESVYLNFLPFFLVLIAFMAGELTWKERVLKLDQVQDALPVRTWVLTLAKIGAMILIQAGLLLVLALTGMGMQAAKGYFRFEPDIYLAYLYGLVFPGLCGLTVLAFFIHAVVNHKFLGHIALVLWVGVFTGLHPLGAEHNLYLFWGMPEIDYSDMNRFGPFVAPAFWFSLYWTLVTLLIGAAAVLLWVRGTDTQLSRRISGARLRTTPALRLGAALTALGAAAAGGFIFYNTNVLNPYKTQRGEKAFTARYERLYKHYEKLPLPRVEAVKVRVDLYPERRQYRMRGTYRLRNRTGVPVRTVPVNLHDDLTVHSITVGQPAAAVVADRKLAFYVYRLDRPLAPGKALEMRFDIAYDRRGFPNDSLNTSIVGNGTFLSGKMPTIGYARHAELSDPDDRDRHDLPPRPRAASLDDKKALRNPVFTSDSDWVTFEAVVSTSPDQVAVAPGSLQKEWTEGGRRVFHYRMDAPIRNFYSFLSARYAVRRDRWKNVAIEVYHHPGHPYNIERMVRGVKRALDYCSRHFGPYQFRQLRIVEFPAYQEFAQSFPGTVPYSESVGFIARVDEKAGDVDYPFYVTAHEVAHQWWAHQVTPADVEGAEMVTESLAEYTALMVMEKEYGRRRMRRFLRHLLDEYLQGRGGEEQEELPLYRVQGQPYIHYNKGGLAFYTLRDAIGEERLNAALARFVEDKGFQQPPYTTSLELLGYLYDATPEDRHPLLADLFETITLYHLAVPEASCKKVGPDRYQVRLTVEAAKARADGTGQEEWIAMEDSFDVGLFARPGPGEELGRPLLVTRKTLSELSTPLTFSVSEPPWVAAIDPFSKRIDRDPEDNLRRVVMVQ